MAETLGSLCDKLVVVKLKQWHTTETARLESLARQEIQLEDEITAFVGDTVRGVIPVERLTFAANKVHKNVGESRVDIQGTLGAIMSQLAHVNCELWHTQEKVYEFESVPAQEKDGVVRELARLNLDRNRCIDAIDQSFRSAIQGQKST